MTDYQVYITDKVLPQVEILAGDDTATDELTAQRLRYLAESILLDLGDELPGKWISVEDELPEIGVEVITCKEDDLVEWEFSYPNMHNGDEWAEGDGWDYWVYLSPPLPS